MKIDELRRAVHSLPGVASADVVPQAGAPPFLRVWTDGTRLDAEVQRSVERLVSSTTLDSDPPPPDMPELSHEDALPPQKPAGRRTGLGRTLGETLPNAFREPEPSHLALEVVAPDPGRSRFLKLAIEESSSGIDVRAIDDVGREVGIALGPGPDGMINAVAAAVARLRGYPVPTRTATNTRDVDDTTVVTVLIELPDGTKAAGAAIVTGGLPFTVGRAVDSALTALWKTSGVPPVAKPTTSPAARPMTPSL